MTTRERDRVISDWLARAECGHVKRAGTGRWEFSVLNGTVVAALASIEEGWLGLVAHVDNTGLHRADWDLLCRNSSLPGLCKFALGSLAGSRQLRAELPMDAEPGFISGPRHLMDACAGFRSALEWIHASAECEGEARIPDTNHNVEADLSHLLDEAGWPYVARSPQKITTELEVRSGYCQAVIENQDGCGLLAYTEVGKWDSLSAEQRQALGAFLLTANGTVRMARATVLEMEHQAIARFEVRLASPGAGELGHALAALSVAANLFGRETQSFEDERIVKAYLAAMKSA